jgi:hypothetical protein
MIQGKTAFRKDPILFVEDNRGKPRFIPIIDKLLTILQVQFEASRTNNKTIPIERAMTDNSKSGSDNAEPEIRNSDYVTRL